MQEQNSLEETVQQIIQQQSGNRASTMTAVTTHSLYIGGGLPTIPDKPVRCIQGGHFIDMADLLPNILEATNLTDDDYSMNTKRK